jgi:ABC-type spermidine/putrescine transport system permease subunit II
MFRLVWLVSVVASAIVGITIAVVLWLKPRRTAAIVVMIVFTVLVVADVFVGKRMLCEFTGRHYVARPDICTG